MTNKNFLSILIGFIFLLSCDTNKFNDQKKRPYDNSKQKLVKKFYDTGNLMYYGKYIDGKKIGKHLEFYDSDDKLIKVKKLYDSLSVDERLLFKFLYDSNGIKTYSAEVKYNILKLELIQIKKDIAFIKIQHNNSRYEFFDFYLKKKNSKKNDTQNNYILHKRDTNNFVIIPINVKDKSIIEIKGFLSNFDIKMINDSIGVTVGDEIYFNKRINVSNLKKRSKK